MLSQIVCNLIFRHLLIDKFIKYHVDNACNFFVNDPLIFCVRCDFVTIYRTCFDNTAVHPLISFVGCDFFGNIGSIHFSENTLKSKQIVVFFCRIVVICYADYFYIIHGKYKFHILTDKNIVSSETAHILDNNGSDQPIFNIFKHTLKVRSVEICTAVSVISITAKISVSAIFCIFFQQLTLMCDTCIFFLLPVIS